MSSRRRESQYETRSTRRPTLEYPAGVAEDFQTKATTLKAKLRYGHKKSTGDLQPQTIRKEGIALNSFFRFISQRGLVNGPQISLELPSRKEKPEPRVWSASSRKKMEDYLNGKIKEYDLVKSRAHRKNAKGHASLNHLRAFMLFDYCGCHFAILIPNSLKIYRFHKVFWSTFVDAPKR